MSSALRAGVMCKLLYPAAAIALFILPVISIIKATRSRVAMRYGGDRESFVVNGLWQRHEPMAGTPR